MTRYQIFYRLNYLVFPYCSPFKQRFPPLSRKKIYGIVNVRPKINTTHYIYKYKKEKSFPTQRFKSSKSILDQSITRCIRIEIEEQTNHLRARCRAADVADAERGCVPPFRR